MKERPIIFSALMVRALLSGTKTQTRRALRKQFVPDAEPAEVPATSPEGWQINGHSGLWWDDTGACIDDAIRCPYGQPGDRLWVRETWGVGSRPDPWGGYDGIEYRADVAWLEDGDDLPCYKVTTPDDICLGDYRSGWKPSIHMPRWASRILLEVTAVRVERLQDISVADAMAEGVIEVAPHLRGLGPCMEWRYAYEDLWRSINGAGSWDENPWVWCISFRRIDAC